MEPNESGPTSYYPQPPSSTVSPTAAAINDLDEKAASLEPLRHKKRGRPRKYASREAAVAAKKAAFSAPVKRNSNFVSVGGQRFTPHVINVAAGEDVGQKLMLFMQHTRMELCILSASGSISNASLCQPATSGGSVAYEGHFDIISLTGSYVHSNLGGRAGGLSVCLASTNGQIVGGGIGGPLIAAGPVEIIVATFLIDPKKDASAGFKADALASTMASPVSTSTAVYRPLVESSRGFTVTTGSDDHHNMDGGPFMMQPQWGVGLNYDLAGNTGHDSRDSPENGACEHMPD